MAGELAGYRVAVLATDGVEESEYTEPRQAFEDAGAHVELVAPHAGEIQAMAHHDRSRHYPVDRVLEQADPDDYDALFLPGGVANPDALRTHQDAVDFVLSFAELDKPVAAICHGPWLLVEADTVRDRTLTSWPSLRTDITNAGGRWVDEPVHTDGMLTTSRKPDDIPVFNDAVIRQFAAHRLPA